MSNLNVLGANLWAHCPGASAHQPEEPLTVPPGNMLINLEWAGHPEIQYPSPPGQVVDGVLKVTSDRFLLPDQDSVLLCQVLGLLWVLPADTINLVYLESPVGHTQITLHTMADIRDALLADIEDILSGTLSLRPGAHCDNCPGALDCPASSPTSMEAADGLKGFLS